LVALVISTKHFFLFSMVLVISAMYWYRIRFTNAYFASFHSKETQQNQVF